MCVCVCSRERGREMWKGVGGSVQGEKGGGLEGKWASWNTSREAVRDVGARGRVQESVSLRAACTPGPARAPSRWQPGRGCLRARALVPSLRAYDRGQNRGYKNSG